MQLWTAGIKSTAQVRWMNIRIKKPISSNSFGKGSSIPVYWTLFKYSYFSTFFLSCSTTQLGIGFASSILLNDPTDPKWKKKFLFVVARYSPRGDYSLNMSSEVGKLKMPDEEMCCRSLGKMRKEGDKNCPTVEKGKSWKLEKD